MLEIRPNKAKVVRNFPRKELCLLQKLRMHMEMMGFLGAGNNPMVGMTVSVAVAVEESLKK